MTKKYELTLNGHTVEVSESTALKASGGRSIPEEGMELETKTQNIADPDHIPKTGTAFIRPKQ